jgi:hypothetical protein
MKMNASIKCADGLTMSVQASAGHYCAPRVTGLGFYYQYEVGYPTMEEPLLLPYAEEPEYPCTTVYGFVPAQVIADVIAKHGGLDLTAVKEEDRPWDWEMSQ